MEYINKIEIQGSVGVVRLQNVGPKKVVRLSVATDFFYKNSNSDPVIETTWHQVNAWEGKTIQGLDQIVKGDKVHVTGRLRTQKYTDSEGMERISYEIQAATLEKLDPSESFSYNAL